MKEEERTYLKKLKRSNGLSNKEADEEIMQFENSQKQFKILNRKLKKQDTVIRNLEKNNEKLKEKIENIKDKLEDLKSAKTGKPKPVPRPKPKKNSNLGKKTFLKDIEIEDEKKLKVWKQYSRRIENNLEPGKSYSKTELSREFLIPAYTMDWIINRLIKNGILDSKEFERSTRYFRI